MNNVEETKQKQESELFKQKIEDFRLEADKKDFSPGSPFKKGAFRWTHNEEDVFTNSALISPSFISGAFLAIDDESVYEPAELKKVEFQKLYPSESGQKVSLLATQSMIHDYFGVTGDSHREALGWEILETDQVMSIASFKEKNVAVCLERSALAQNILTFYGEEVMMLCGECDVDDHDKGDPHTFSLLKNEEGYVIYDATNPVTFKNKEGFIVGRGPAIYKISLEEVNILLCGDQYGVTVEHNSYLYENEVKTLLDIKKRTYRTYSQIRDLKVEF